MSKPLSEAHKAAISRANKGKVVSLETRAKLSAAHLGITLTQETKAKLSAMRKGVPKSEAHRAAIGNALRGKRKTDSVNYNLVHGLMGQASEHFCECGKRALDWAYQYTAIEVLYSPQGWPYSVNPADYKPMCRSCHKKFDGAHHD